MFYYMASCLCVVLHCIVLQCVLFEDAVSHDVVLQCVVLHAVLHTVIVCYRVSQWWL